MKVHPFIHPFQVWGAPSRQETILELARVFGAHRQEGRGANLWPFPCEATALTTAPLS